MLGAGCRCFKIGVSVFRDFNPETSGDISAEPGFPNPALSASILPRAAYIHIPFCRAKCCYCDFNSYPGLEHLFEDYVESLILEIGVAEPTGAPLESVYFGGGTPTILPASALARILDAVRDRFGLAGGAEITVEANPGTVDAPGLALLRAAGFNRLSIGVQSFDDRVLSRLGRVHTSGQARDGFRLGRDAGFENIGIDLMYGLPGQSVSEWERTLESALGLAPEHVSLYELSIEEGTVFGNLRRASLLDLPDEDAQIEMYLTAINALAAAGYEHYEMSNLALPGRRSRHNQTYWRNEPYFGFGAGASGCVAGVRYTNLRRPEDYIESTRATGSAVESSEALTGRQAMGETIMLGLRMIEGVDLGAFRERFGVELAEVYGRELGEPAARGLVELTETRLRLSEAGLLIANEVAAEFL